MSRRQFIKQLGALVVAAGAWPGAPAVRAQPHFEWKMAMTWPKDFPGVGTGANYLAQAIADMSNHRLVIKVYAGGELAPPLGVFDAVAQGTAEMGHTVAYYCGKKHPAASFFGGVPFGLNAVEMQTWLNFGGGMGGAL